MQIMARSSRNISSGFKLWAFTVLGWLVACPFSARPQLSEMARGVRLLERGERTLDGTELFAAEAIFLKECSPGRDPRCEYYLARVYLAEYSYWSEIRNDAKRAEQCLAKAEFYGKAAVLRRPDDPETHVLMGRIYMVKLMLNPVFGLAQTLLSESPVVREYQLALQLDPQNGQAELGLGIYYQFIPLLFGGDSHRARTHFKRAAKLMPDNPEPLVWLSISYREEGRLAEARRFLDRALALDPNNRFVRAEDERLKAAENARKR